MFLVTFLLTIFWGISGHHIARDVIDQEAGGMTNKIIRELKNENPQAAAELTHIRENSDIRLSSSLSS